MSNPGTPLLIPASEITTGWQGGKVSYAFSNEYSSRLDHLSDQHRLSMENNIIGTEESDSAMEDESEDSDNGDDGEEHEVELTLLTRKRVIRNSEGNRITSYKDLAGVGSGRRVQRRQILQVENNDDLVSAQRDSVIVLYTKVSSDKTLKNVFY
jgi:hypothetical protein